MRGTASWGNSIHDNGLLGIDLNNDGVTYNDRGDGDTGPNAKQNFPKLTGANTVGGNTTITGTFNSTANTTYRIEYFSSPIGDGTGYGEGHHVPGHEQHHHRTPAGMRRST